jgi:mono/diheme cytochrome c family protein
MGQPGPADRRHRGVSRRAFLEAALILLVIEAASASGLLLADPARTGLAARVAAAQANGQSDPGQQVFARICSRCHGDDGQGTADAPRLLGSGSNVPSYSREELEVFVSTYMPGDAPGALSGEQYSAVVDFLRRENGLP